MADVRPPGTARTGPQRTWFAGSFHRPRRRDHAQRPYYVKSWAELEFLPGALEGLALLAARGWRVAIVTNQAIVNRGLVSANDLDLLHAQMAATIATRGGAVAAVFACPHRPGEGCACRKPAPGLLLAAARHFSVPLPTAVFVGDQLSDLETARRAGCRSVLVSNNCASGRIEPLPDGCLSVVPNLLAAAEQIIAMDGTSGSEKAVGTGGRR